MTADLKGPSCCSEFSLKFVSSPNQRTTAFVSCYEAVYRHAECRLWAEMIN